MIQDRKVMKKNSLIEMSILAVVLLVLCSLSNVVGYQSVTSAVNESPLFQTRTQRATNSQQNMMIAQYLGGGKENQLQFPTKNTTLESALNAIKIITQMDDKTFARFTAYCIQRIKSDISSREVNTIEILQSLYFLKAKPQLIMDFMMDTRNQHLTSEVIRSICYNWYLGCSAVAILRYILESIVILFAIVYFHFISYCSDTYAPCGDVSKLHYILKK